MAASMPMSASRRSVYFRCLLAIAVLIWPVGVVGQSSVSDNVVVQWDAAALQGVRDSRIGPPMVARALAIAHTCIFDAWAAYDTKALGTRLGGEVRRPKTQRTLANKNEAISFASQCALVERVPADQASIMPPTQSNL